MAVPGPEGYALQGIGFDAEGRSLLRDVSFTLKPGRVVGIIGHNGSGKSTLLKLLARQQAPNAGALVLDGRSLSSWSSRAFARMVAYLPQTPPSAGALKVRELVACGRYPWHGALGRKRAQDGAAVETALALADVAGFADRLVETLSGGERQRAWLAMLVAQEARYLLLDEPTAALDVAHQVDVMVLARRLAHGHGLGVAVVLHDVNMAARYCDELVALRGGRLLMSGAPQDVVTAEALAEIYGIPMAVMPHPDGGWPVSFVR
ncbi:ATP-binding cassette domain-containing protein [Xanthobacter autotrophicus]|nr:ATP-binding cassette domain-containing protein [Xanthobacter autotrophicus]MDI4665505.1 ATP-binding cassette domain-containing protein [Xanthobacter autotrophicus]